MNNLKNGQGFEKSKKGNVYVGSYKDGRFHGYGVFTSSDGKQYKGMWENGKLIKQWKNFHQ